MEMLPGQRKRYIRPQGPRNRLSKQQRLLAPTPKHELVLKHEVPMFVKLLELQMLLIDCDMPSLELQEIILQKASAIDDATLYDEADEIIPPAPRPKILDVASAVNILGSVQFERQFGLSARYARRLADLLFGDTVLSSQHRHGSIGGEMALLMVMARFRCNIGTMQSISYIFGLNNGEGKISDFLRLTCEYLYTRFKHLLALENLSRFAPFTRAWGEAMERKYIAISHNPNVTAFPPAFHGVNCAVDGFRLPVARPIRGQEPFYSG